MGVNADLLNKTVEEIETDQIKWYQGDWIRSAAVPAGLSPNKFDNECGTSYCFAGRVASLKREQLYNRTWMGLADDDDTPRYRASMYLVALPGDEMTDSADDLYTAEVVDGKVEFIPFEGRVIEAEYAAGQDLDINYDARNDLFAGFNDLGSIKSIVENIIEQGDNYTTIDEDNVYCCENCDGY